MEDLIKKWQDRQRRYEDLAEKHRDNDHNYKKFTYKAMATRDCWKELLKLNSDAGSRQRNLLEDYFKWHKDQGFISHKDSDIDEFLADKH